MKEASDQTGRKRNLKKYFYKVKCKIMYSLWVELKQEGTNDRLVHGSAFDYKNTLICNTKKERTPRLGALTTVGYFWEKHDLNA
jgi:hypothetical protein